MRIKFNKLLFINILLSKQKKKQTIDRFTRIYKILKYKANVPLNLFNKYVEI